MADIFYIGDSTVAWNSPETYPQTGMSQGLSKLVQPGVRVISLAKNGRSTKSFLDEGLFVPAQEGMRSGDLLLIQFGHNDEKADLARHTEPDTTFRENLRFYISEARARGAFPVLITPIARRLFDEAGNFLPGSHGAYPAAMGREGMDSGVPVVNMTAITEGWLPTLGDEPSKPFFMVPIDNTHLTEAGADLMASFLRRELYHLGEPYSAFVLPPAE